MKSQFLPPTFRSGCATGIGYSAHIRNGETSCESCREGNRKYAAKYRKKNSEKSKQIVKNYKQRNAQKVKKSCALYREKNREELRLKSEIRYSENRNYFLNHYKKNPEIVKKNVRIRRARKNLVPSEPYTVRDILDAHGTNCHICHTPIDMKAPRQAGQRGWQKGLHLDHVIPISKGGADTISNVKPAHGRCNLKKSAN